MGDVGDSYKLLKELNKQRKEDNLKNASKEGWHLHTEWHWSRSLNGERLDYWPSKRKFRYKGETMTGDVEGFIKNRE